MELPHRDIDHSDNALLSLYRFHRKYPCRTEQVKHVSTRKETRAIARRRLKFSHRLTGGGNVSRRYGN